MWRAVANVYSGAGRGAQGHGNQQGQHRPFQQHGVQPHTAPHAPQEGAHGPDAEKPPELYDAAPGGGGKFQRAFIQRSGGAPFMMMPHHVAEPVAFQSAPATSGGAAACGGRARRGGLPAPQIRSPRLRPSAPPRRRQWPCPQPPSGNTASCPGTSPQ